MGVSGGGWGPLPGTQMLQSEGVLNRQGGKTPLQKVPYPLERGSPLSVTPPSPRKGKLKIRGLFQQPGGALTATPRRRGRPGPQERVPLPGGPSDPDGEPDFWRPRPGAGGGGSRGAPPAACPHSPSARPQAAPTAARKRSICVSFLLSGSHITWHSRISSRLARSCLDMAAVGAAWTALGPVQGLGPGRGPQARRRGPGAAGQRRRPVAASATERSAGTICGIPDWPRPIRPRPSQAPPLRV